MSWRTLLKREAGESPSTDDDDDYEFFIDLYDGLVYELLGNETTGESDKEAYDKLTDEEKLRFHKDMINYTVKFPIFRREHLFHQRMSARIRSGYNRQTFPTIEEYEKKGVKFDRIQNKPKNVKRESLIVNYFQLWKVRYGRIPTLDEIKEEEGRPLTLQEIETYKKMREELL